MKKPGKVATFLYGLMTAEGVIEAVTGINDIPKTPAVLKGYTLCVQKLDQIPDVSIIVGKPDLAPQKLLRETWGDSFESYIIKRDPDGEVAGNIAYLSPEAGELLANWELEELGWFQTLHGEAVTDNGVKINVVTDGLREGQQVDRKVDGHNYTPLQPWQNLPDVIKVAERERSIFLQRRTHEGAIQPSIESDIMKR